MFCILMELEKLIIKKSNSYLCAPLSLNPLTFQERGQFKSNIASNKIDSRLLGFYLNY